MRFFSLSVSLCILNLAFPTGAFAQDKDVIYWQTYHRPPSTIKSGEFKNQGFIDKTLALIISKMTEYEHELPSASLARAIMDIKMGKNACHPALHITEERKSHMYFSQPAMINPTNRIIGHKSDLDGIATNGAIRSKTFVSGKTFALIKYRSYAGGYDEFVESYIPADKTVYIASEKISTLFLLVATKRVDYTIGYPFELEHFLINTPSVNSDLVAYRLPDSPAYTIGAIACPKTPWGKKVITRINEVLDEIKPTQAYQEALTTWWESERDTARFNEFYRDVFLNHASSGVSKTQ